MFQADEMTGLLASRGRSALLRHDASKTASDVQQERGATAAHYGQALSGSRPWPERTRAYQDWIIRVVNDARRAMEYLHSRADIRHDAIAFLGVSWGASLAPRILTLETRFKTAVLLDGGLTQSFDVPPPLDSVNYLPRVTLPTLMVSGNSDFIYPVEAGQKPYFDLLGTPRDQKRHVVLVGGHGIVAQQRSQVVKTVLDWLDERLGPVNTSSAAASR